MRKLFDFFRSYPRIYLFIQLFLKLPARAKESMEGMHAKHRLQENLNTISIDLGCGMMPSNKFNAELAYGVDIVENVENNVRKLQLGFEKIPFPDNHFDYVTAYDLLEHIPRFANLSPSGNCPFIYLMNEIWRVTKPGGIFFSSTPIYPFLGAFQDPTHVNIMTEGTLRIYFSDKKIQLSSHYGIEANFKILEQKMFGQHLIAVLQK